MEILRTKAQLAEFRQKLGASVGYVPTMGALHEGHASLIRRAVSENEAVIVSVFLNPKQFLAGEDLDKYPKNEDGDAKICQECGAAAIFMPSVDEIYDKDEASVLAPKRLAGILEGETRPGHFDGVCTVLNKFFNLIRPARAYFGKKDAQQLAIVQKMVQNFAMPVEIKACEIVRAKDGLALSSRNSYLNEVELCDALKLSRALSKAANLVKGGELGSNVIKLAMRESLEPLKVDYVAIVNREFDEIEKVKPGETIILLAVYIGKTRLIDNLWV